MKRRAVILGLVAVLLVGGLISGFPLYLHYFRYPPAPAQLLPQNADAYIYVDLGPIRRVAKIEPGSLFSDTEIAAFSQETGIVPERDIDEVAVAVLHGPKTATGELTYRSGEVITGHFNRARLLGFLQRVGHPIYHRDQPIYEIPREDRTVRVTNLDDRTVAITNTSGPETIAYMIDRLEHVGFPRSGPYRMNAAFKQVPFGSIAWASLHIAESYEEGFKELPIGSVRFALPPGSEVVASARVLTAIELRAQTSLANEREAQKLSDQLANFLTLFRAVEITIPSGGADPDVKQLFESLRVERDGRKVTLTAEVPFSFVSKLARETQAKPSDQMK